MRRGLLVSFVVHALVFIGVFFMPRSSARWDRVDAIPVNLVAPVASRAQGVEAPPAPAPEPAAPAEREPPSKVADPKDAAVKPAPAKKTATPPKRNEPRRFQKMGTPADDEPSLEERVRRRLEDESDEAATRPASDPSRPTSSSKEGAASGVPTSTAEIEATDFPYAWYLNLLRTKIGEAWDPPASRLLAGRANQVIIRFHLGRDGSVSDVEVEVVSGAPGLDSSARRAVDRAQPFPPLPEGYPEDSVEIAVRFTVSEGAG